MNVQGTHSLSVLHVFATILKRDLTLAYRRRQDLVNPMIFFVIVVSLFPLGVSPEKSFLQEAGAGVVWVAALLATLLSLDSLFRSDYEDGSLEQMILTPQPLFIMVLAKIFAHWLVTGVPLLILSPVLGVMMHLEFETIKAVSYTHLTLPTIYSV